MADSFFQDAIDGLGEMAEWRIPAVLADRLAQATNNASIAAAIRDIIAGVPGILDWPLHVMAQRLYSRGTTASRVAGALIDLVPPLATEVRQRTGITEEQARAETARRFMEKYASIRSTLPTIGGHVANPSPAPAPTTPVPVSSVSRIQQNIGRIAGEGAFTQEEKLILVYMFRVLRIEGNPGSDIVAELEGEARSGQRGLLDAIKDNSADIKAIFSTIGNDFSLAYISFEAMRTLERDGDVTSTNRAAWREAAANFVRLLMPVFEFILMGHADRNPDSTMAAAALDALDRLNMFAGLEPSSAFQRARSIQQTVSWVGRGLLVVFGLILLYFLVVVQLASSSPELLGSFAWWSTWIIIGGSAVTTIFGALSGRTRIALLGATIAFALSPIVLTVAWVVAVVFTPVPDWRGFWMALIVVIGLDLITFSLTQKVVQTIGGIPAFLLSFLPKKEEAKAAAEKLAQQSFLANISSTIAGAIVLLWLPIVVMYIAETPVPIRTGSLAVIAVAACVYGYMKRAATMRDYTTYKGKKEAELFEKHNIENANLAYKTLKAVTIGAMVVYGLVWFFGTEQLASAKDDLVHGTGRAAKVISATGDTVLTKAEKVVAPKNDTSKPKESTPTTSTQQSKKPSASGATKICGGAEKSASKVSKDLAALNKAVGGDYCRGKTSTYPCNCK